MACRAQKSPICEKLTALLYDRGVRFSTMCRKRDTFAEAR
jgi:hypothetical protein